MRYLFFVLISVISLFSDSFIDSGTRFYTGSVDIGDVVYYCDINDNCHYYKVISFSGSTQSTNNDMPLPSYFVTDKLYEFYQIHSHYNNGTNRYDIHIYDVQIVSSCPNGFVLEDNKCVEPSICSDVKVYEDDNEIILGFGDCGYAFIEKTSNGCAISVYDKDGNTRDISDVFDYFQCSDSLSSCTPNNSYEDTFDDFVSDSFLVSGLVISGLGAVIGFVPGAQVVAGGLISAGIHLAGYGAYEKFARSDSLDSCLKNSAGFSTSGSGSDSNETFIKINLQDIEVINLGNKKVVKETTNNKEFVLEEVVVEGSNFNKVTEKELSTDEVFNVAYIEKDYTSRETKNIRKPDTDYKKYIEVTPKNSAKITANSVVELKSGRINKFDNSRTIKVSIDVPVDDPADIDDIINNALSNPSAYNLSDSNSTGSPDSNSTGSGDVANESGNIDLSPVTSRQDREWNYVPSNSAKAQNALNELENQINDDSIVTQIQNVFTNVSDSINQAYQDFENAKNILSDKPNINIPAGSCGFTLNAFGKTFEIDICETISPYRPILSVFFTFLFTIAILLFAIKYLFNFRS